MIWFPGLFPLSRSRKTEEMKNVEQRKLSLMKRLRAVTEIWSICLLLCPALFRSTANILISLSPQHLFRSILYCSTPALSPGWWGNQSRHYGIPPGAQRIISQMTYCWLFVTPWPTHTRLQLGLPAGGKKKEGILNPGSNVSGYCLGHKLRWRGLLQSSTEGHNLVISSMACQLNWLRSWLRRGRTGVMGWYMKGC